MWPMNNRLKKSLAATRNQPAAAQGGFVLIIALIVLAAMTLAAAAMVRTVDTSTLLARNISFKRDAVNRNDFALEAAINQFRAGGALRDGANTLDAIATQNYSAVMLPTDADGVPLALKNADTSSNFYLPANSSLTPPYPGGTLGIAAPSKIPAGLVLEMYPIYLIERMCTTRGIAAAETCIVNGRAQAGGTQPNDKPGQLFPPMYRITARVTGPRNTVSYVQAIFSLQNT